MAGEMVERVAAVIEEAVCEYQPRFGTDKECAEAIARAVIKAMREPTPEIIAAGQWKDQSDAYCPDKETALEWSADQWREYIDAALDEKPLVFENCTFESNG